jgi:hypothetical protein
MLGHSLHIFLVRIIGFYSYTTLKELDQFFLIFKFFSILKIRPIFIFMNKIILACFQDDRFSLILVVVAWIGACQWMYICVLFTGDIFSPKSKN